MSPSASASCGAGCLDCSSGTDYGVIDAEARGIDCDIWQIGEDFCPIAADFYRSGEDFRLADVKS